MMSSSYFPDQRLKQTIQALPVNPRKTHHYINLTNGLEAVPRLKKIIGSSNINICRLQSSHCEASRPDLLLPAIDASMLFWLAQGHTVLVYDFGSRNKKRGAPRALWYGLEFLKYVLGYVWYNDRYPRCIVRGYNVQKEFEAMVQNHVDRSTMKKLKYYRKYSSIGNKGISLYGVYSSTLHDADEEYYKHLAQTAFDDDDTSTYSAEYIDVLSQGIPFDETYGYDRMHPIEEILGMRLFLGGVELPS